MGYSFSLPILLVHMLREWPIVCLSSVITSQRGTTIYLIIKIIFITHFLIRKMNRVLELKLMYVNVEFVLMMFLFRFSFYCGRDTSHVNSLLKQFAT